MKRSYYLKRIIPCALVILICLWVILMSVEIPGRTDENRFRLAERAQLVGPSKIIGQEENLGLFGDVILGETDCGYTLFECASGELHYRPKAADFTLICPPELPVGYPEGSSAFPAVVFAETGSAVSAQLTIQICTTNSGTLLTSSHSAKAQRSENGCFPFLFRFPDTFGSRTYGFLLEMLNGQRCTEVLIYGKIILELYDNGGNLLETYIRDYCVPDTQT